MTDGLVLTDVRAGFGPIEVLHGISMTFPLGSVVALLGRNGAGKSTLLRTVAGTITPTSGSIGWMGRDVTAMPAHRRAAAGITLVPDEAGVFGAMSVRDNLEVFAGRGGIDPAIEVFGELERLLDRRAGTLSGGERQMVALSRAVLRPGRAVLLDEVSRGLSPAAIVRLAGAIAGLASPERTVVIVEQYLHDALRLADTVYVLRRGEISFSGEPAELAAEYAGSGL